MSNTRIEIRKYRKRKTIKKIILCVVGVLFILAIAFTGYNLLLDDNNEPVNGKRGRNLISLASNDKELESKLNNIEKQVKQEYAVENIEISLNARLFKVNIETSENIVATKDMTQDIVGIMDKTLSSDNKEAVAYPNSQYSSLFNKKNDSDTLGQYSINFIINNSKNDEHFPLFGTKHPCIDNVSFSNRNT